MIDGGWIGVDLDGTLAEWQAESSVHEIGPPIPAMTQRVLNWCNAGQDVRIFTARVGVCGETSHEGTADQAFADYQRRLIQDWCQAHLGRVLPVTATKDFRMIELWDDRCKQVISNRGVTVEELYAQAVGRRLEYEGV